MGRRLLLAVLLVAALAAPGTARAAAKLAPCGKTQGLVCGEVQVPLDRSGVFPGSISLHVEVLPGSARGTQKAMFLIAGGPGQGSAGAFDLGDQNQAEFMQALLPGYTLVAFDNRGTGQSGLLDCPALQTTVTTSVEQEQLLARDCAAIIGPTRQFYATRDHVEDIEAVRTALGLGKVALFGVSYGTKLALAYALGHPSEVERLLLDSVVPPSYPDPFDENVLQEMPGTARAFCANGACAGATPDFAGDLVALANRLEAKPIQGKVLTPSGKTTSKRMTGEDVLGLMIDADLSPGLAAELPAAIHAARNGYTLPLLRLYDLDTQTSTLSAQDLSFALYAATNCADGKFPWSPDTPPSARPSLIDAAIGRLAAGSLGPFGNWAARIGNAFFCELWPSPAGNTPLGTGPLPNVPMLAVSGGFDMRTPTVNARSIVSLFPQGHLLVVPGVGHSVLSTDFSYCSQRAVRNWILTGAVPPTSCAPVPPDTKILGAFPGRHVGRSVASTLAVAGKALREAEASWFQAVFASESLAPSGLYGGRLAPSQSAAGFTLTKYAIAPGVLVSGKLTVTIDKPPFGIAGTVKVTGAAAVRGTLHVAATTLTGTLGRRHVSGSY